jgi:oligopeptidase A
MSDIKATNPLLNFSGFPKFSEVKPEHLKEALEQCINNCREKVISLCEKYGHNPSYENLLAPLNEADDELSRVWSVASHLNNVCNTEEFRKAYEECLPLISEYSSWIGQYRPLYEAEQALKNSPDFESLPLPKRKACENSLRDFRLSGVNLDEEKQQRYTEISTRLSQLQSQFANNVLDATHGFVLEISDFEDLKGLPSGAIRLAKSEAESQGKEGWIITLDMPSYVPFLTYADKRELRQKLYEAYTSRASEIGPNAGQWDNTEVMEEILKLRHELAKLLGFKSYAHLSLETKMAPNPETVVDFLTNLAKKSYAQGQKEMAELRTYAREHGADYELEPWDIAYWSEKLRQERYAYNAEELRPYFPVDKVISGLFECAHRLYGVSFKERQGDDVWNEYVRTYDIYEDKFCSVIGTFYMDLYARQGKQGGAWMDECLTRRYRQDGTLQLPVTYLVCNFTRPVGSAQSQLTHDEVVTLFHEFGHGLNQLLTRIDVADVSGINGVPWDAVELPSQFNENFAWQKEALPLLSSHISSHESLPEEKIQSLLNAKNFHSAMAMLRQLEFALFDFRLHLEYQEGVKGQVQKILDEVRSLVTVVPVSPNNRFANGFTHIFAGGYAAGYYSYKWAEVLAADAFGRFIEDGIFDRKAGGDFADLILSCGGACDPMANFVKFRGREPQVEALLEQSGISYK